MVLKRKKDVNKTLRAAIMTRKSDINKPASSVLIKSNGPRQASFCYAWTHFGKVLAFLVLVLIFFIMRLSNRSPALPLHQLSSVERNPSITKTNKHVLGTNVTANTHHAASSPEPTIKKGNLKVNNNSNNNNNNKEKYLVYITTLLSREDQQYFRHCWPELLKKNRLLQEADILIFSYNTSAIEDNGSFLSFLQNDLFYQNPSFRLELASESVLQDITQPSKRDSWMVDRGGNVIQLGENEAVHQGFRNGWFVEYSWVIRIHPDVLIRKSSWLLETMKDPTVDAILVECSKDPLRIHTDFFAIRPSACHPNAFEELARDVLFEGHGSHAMTAAKEFQPFLQGNRYRWLPDNVDSNGFCEVRGKQSSVLHAHEPFQQRGANGKIVCEAVKNFKMD